MSNIRYICMSDLHLGGETSLLTNVTENLEENFDSPSPVLVALAGCLRSLIAPDKQPLFEQDSEHNHDQNPRQTPEQISEQDTAKETHPKPTLPTLILCGDTLEFALAPDNQGAMAFRQFIEQVLPEGGELFDEIIYIPGNHDHHIWETARETQYSAYIETLKTDEEIKPPWFTTNLFIKEGAEPVLASLPSTLASMYPNLKAKDSQYKKPEGKDFLVRAMYPNFGLFNEENHRCVVFHHGHYTESIYTLMSQIKTMAFPQSKFPEQVWDMEAENHAWVDFFWSMLGRSGETGCDISLVYNGRENMAFIDELIDNLSVSLAGVIEKETDSDMPSFFDLHLMDELQKKVLAKVLDWFISMGADRILATERHDDTPLTDGSRDELAKYIEVQVRNQLVSHRKDTASEMSGGMTFVFGHTHKPFKEIMNFKDYPPNVKVYNTGGWTSEGLEARPVVGGAIVCLDEDLTPVSIRMYSDEADLTKFRVSVEEALGANEEHSLFYDEIANTINADTKPWTDFSKTVGVEIKTRREIRNAQVKKEGQAKQVSTKI